MKQPLTFRGYLRLVRWPDVALIFSALWNLVLIAAWVLYMPFAPFQLWIRRRLMGKRIARRWRAKHGDNCPATFRWWMKYM